jgi:hypothetical protein
VVRDDGSDGEGTDTVETGRVAESVCSAERDTRATLREDRDLSFARVGYLFASAVTLEGLDGRVSCSLGPKTTV